MLTQAGIQFKRHEDEGIDINDFAELLTSSGLVLSEEVSWVTFARWVGGGGWINPYRTDGQKWPNLLDRNSHN